MIEAAPAPKRLTMMPTVSILTEYQELLRPYAHGGGTDTEVSNVS